MTPRLSGLILAILAFAAPAVGQTTSTLLWDYPGVAPAVVATYQQAVTVDGVAVTGTPSCTGSATLTICSLTVPGGTGSKTYAVTATLNGVQRTTMRAIDPGVGPVQPGNPRITVTVTVTL
jgi:hypothetical protein